MRELVVLLLQGGCTPNVPNTFLVPAIDPYHIRVQHREAEIHINDYEPLDGPNSDESEEDTP